MTVRKLLPAGLLAGIVLSLLAACGGESPAPATFTLTPTPEPTITTDGSVNATAAQTALPLPPNQPGEEPIATPTAAAIGPTLPAPPTFTPSPTIPPTATRFFPTSSIRQRMTLPPSWTPTPTPTVTLTRTVTLTPTLTDTPTLTPTRSLETLCEGVVAVLQVEPGREYTFDDEIDFVIASDDPNVDFEMVMVNEAARFEETIPLEGGQAILGQYLLRTLDDTGTYTWTVTASRGEASGLCEQSYTFTIRQPSLLESLVDAISTINANTTANRSASGTPPSPMPTETEPTTPPTPTPGLFIPPEMQATLDTLLQTPLATVTASPAATTDVQDN